VAPDYAVRSQVTSTGIPFRRAALARHEAALISERDRLAREVHDVLSHTLGAVSVQLTALDSRVAAGDAPTDVRERIEAIHRLVGEGLGEARDAVRALRGDGLSLLGQVSRLCELHGASFDVQGQARAHRPNVGHALYRVAQEALTNAEKHAPNAPVSVRLSSDPDLVSIRIDNQRPASDACSPLASAGGGHGLRGMRERVQLAGGHLHAGPTEDGWRVTAEIPVARAIAPRPTTPHR
jgi:signal transduction histidine kinase